MKLSTGWSSGIGLADGNTDKEGIYLYDIWKKQAINDLEKYEAKKQALINIPDQIKELEERMSSIRSQTADSVSVKGGGGSRDDMYLNNIVARDRLQENLEEARRAVSRISGALGILNEDEKELLKRFYMNPEKGVAYNIADEKHVDHKTVYRWKDLALHKFATAMYGGS